MIVETMPRIPSTLNPNAPLYVPASYHATEDFSPEWWNLIQTAPAFRDYWLRERSAQVMEEESPPLDDIDDLDFEDLLEMELQCEEDENAGRKRAGNGAVRNIEKDVLSALALGVNPNQRVWREPLKCHEKILNKSPRSPRKSVNMHFRIQQPRP